MIQNLLNWIKQIFKFDKNNFIILLFILFVLGIPLYVTYELSTIVQLIVLFIVIMLLMRLILSAITSILEKYNAYLVKQDLKDYGKYKSRHEKANLNLFSWSGEETSIDYIMYYLFNGELNRIDPIDNFKVMKEKIKLRMGSNKEDYIFLKKYIEYTEKNNLLSFIKKVSLVVGTFIIGQIALGDKLSNIFSNDTQTKEGNSDGNGGKVENPEEESIENTSSDTVFIDINQQFLNSSSEIILNIFQYSILAFFFIFFITYIYKTFSKEKRRISILKLIIETIIEEDKF